MGDISKKITSPFATGGGGVAFETDVQTLFAVLMITDGYVPCLPNSPIEKIKLQGKHKGYDSDDLIVFVTNPERKMLAQIRHSINITKSDRKFGEVIQAAWSDFNNYNIFNRDHDVIALITGPLSATDIDHTRPILEWSRTSEDARDFIDKVKSPKFSSKEKREKLYAFKDQLKKANGGTDVSDDDLFNFMKHFHLFNCDLDIKCSVNSSLVKSLIKQHFRENGDIWNRLRTEVKDFNKTAGTITPEYLKNNLEDILQPRTEEKYIPKSYVEKTPEEDSIERSPPLSSGILYQSMEPPSTSWIQQEEDTIDWGQHNHAADLAIATLIGAWNEDSEADQQIIEQLSEQKYSKWIKKIRKILPKSRSLLKIKNNQWSIKDRGRIWDTLGSIIFDTDLDKFRKCALEVLGEIDPKFELPPEKRYMASLYEKTPRYSNSLRNGIAEGLALIGTRSSALSNCSQYKNFEIVKNLLQDAKWDQWGSLNEVLPLLAEASPNEFLNAVETALASSPNPFSKLFTQEGTGITGSNYLTGLLWGLESLAWDPEYLVRSCRNLAVLATHDPGGQWGNRPSNSLTTILLPWLPQTLAPPEKRKVALRTIVKEAPDAAWQLLLSLLPARHQSSSGTYKPKWRETIPEEREENVNQKEYSDQVKFYVDLAVKMASTNIDKLGNLISNIDVLPLPSFESLLGSLSSNKVTGLPEDKRFHIWSKLVDIANKHRAYSHTDWALPGELVEKIEEVSEKLKPQNYLYPHQRLFSEPEAKLYETKNQKEEQKTLQHRRIEAIDEILSRDGIDAVVEFSGLVESPFRVGDALGARGGDGTDTALLPSLLLDENKKHESLISSYVWSRQSHLGWKWVDSLDKRKWTEPEIVAFLIRLPFSPETWERASELLGYAEREYWSKADVTPHRGEGKLDLAIGRLIEFGRPYSAIYCLFWLLQNKKEVDIKCAVTALLSNVKIEKKKVVDEYYYYQVKELIKFIAE